MTANQQTGAAGNTFGRMCGRRVAQWLNASNTNSRSNECTINGSSVVIKCANSNTSSVGISCAMLPKLRELNMISGRVIQQFATLTLFAVVLAGCSPKSPVVPSSAPSHAPKSIAQLGAEMQRAGIMSQKDYIRVVNLEHKLNQTPQISDEDFAWTLSLLKTSGNSMARARAMGVLSDIHPMSSAQKAQITSAIAPYLNSKDPLDLASVRRAQRSLQRN